MSENMSYSDVLYEMQELRAKWREQTYVLEQHDQERYDMLLEVRRLRVSQLYADGRAHLGGMQS